MFPASFSRRAMSKDAFSAWTIVCRSSSICSFARYSIKGGPGSGGKVEHDTRHSKLGFLEPRGSYSIPEWHVEDIEKVHHRDKFQIRLAAGSRKLNRRLKDRIVEEPRLHQVCLRDARSRENRLKVAIVHKATWTASSAVSFVFSN